MEAPLQNLYCEIHQKRQVQFIDLSKDPEDKNRFYCPKCLMTRLNSNIKDSGLVDVDDLINKVPVKDIMNWPKIQDENLRKIQDVIQITDINEEKTKMIRNIIEKFDEYLENFIQECQQIKKKTIVKIEEYFDGKEEDIKTYSEETKLDQFYDMVKLIDSFDNVNIIDRTTEEKNLNLDKYIKELNALEEQYIQEQTNLNLLNQDMFIPIQYSFLKQIQSEQQIFSKKIEEMKFMKKTDILQQIPNKKLFYFEKETNRQNKLISCIFSYRQKIKFKTEFISQTPFKENDDHFGFDIFEYNKNKFSSNQVVYLNCYATKRFKFSPGLYYNNEQDIKIFGSIYKGNNEKIQIIFEICPQEGILIINESNNKYSLKLVDNIFPKQQWGFRFHWNKQKQYSFNIKYIP